MNRLGWCILIIIICIMLFGTSCGTGTLLNPVEVDRQEIIDSQVELVTPLGFSITTHPDLTLTTFGEDQIMVELDRCIVDYAMCMYENTESHVAIVQWMQEFKFYITDTTFICPFSDGRGGYCNGFASITDRFIVLAREAPLRDGVIPLCEHEIAHAVGDYASDHCNLTPKLEECIIYPNECKSN